jgi:hypothetical protein
MNQGTQGYSLTKKTEGRKSRDTVSLKAVISCLQLKYNLFNSWCYMAFELLNFLNIIMTPNVVIKLCHLMLLHDVVI